MNRRVHSIEDVEDDELAISFDRHELGAIIKRQQTLFSKNSASEVFQVQ